MIKKYLFVFFLFISPALIHSQTTDLAVVVEAQDVSGNGISQIQIYQEFQYVITIINSGNAVSNATFSQNINQNVSEISAISQNNVGGASPASGFNVASNNLTGSVANLPNNSSVQIKVSVIAPTTLGGIATTVTVFPPQGIQDVDLNNNQSIISIDVVDVTIDFSVVYSQVTPPQGTGISEWDDSITYEFTITNNSAITYPLAGFLGIANLETPLIYGRPRVQLMSIACLGGSNGTACPDVSGFTSNPIVVSSTQTLFSFGTPHAFTSGGSLTFRIVYTYLQPLCAFEQEPISTSSFVRLALNHSNESSNSSNSVTNDLLLAELCQFTDICIETIQTNPAPSTIVNWGEEVTFATTVCNNGPLEAPILFFLQNLSVNIQWDIMSLTCIGTTGSIDCADIQLSEQNNVWSSNIFVMPVGATITVETVLVFIEPECSTSAVNAIAHARTGLNITSTEIIDSNTFNNAESDFVTLPPTVLCASADLQVTKTQISPALPEGSSPLTTTDWGSIAYEITVTNPSHNDTFIELSDYMPTLINQFVSGTLLSVDCISTTGAATCFPIDHANIGILMDGEPQQGMLDVFWEILPEDNWQLPAQSSVTFQVVIDWAPECSTLNILAVNEVTVSHVGNIIEIDNSNNNASVSTYFAPCVDLIVQTFPQFTQVNTNQNFDWIVDITNSNTSSNAVDIYVEDVLSPVFTILGTPTCEITSGNASCISSFSINGNTINGIIPNMEAGSTIRIRIPVEAPAFGGAFSNRAEAIPSEADNEELTPETNISISNVQVIAPTLLKSFNPTAIFVGDESVLMFTVTNISSNPSQNTITFTDNLPDGLTLAGVPSWINSNGCTTTFSGTNGDTFVGVTNLTFPSGVVNCSFSVPVTSSLEGIYLNDTTNFSDKNNIDTSQASATLTVLEDMRNVDIVVEKIVFPEDAFIGSEVDFTITITNLGTTTASLITIYERLPSGYLFVSSNTSSGTYETTTFLWSVGSLSPNDSETLTITARVISSINLLNIAFLESVNEPDLNDSNNEDSAEVLLNDCLQIPEGISPNADGLNDFLIIPCIEDYPNHVVKIFNRLGVQVYENRNYKNDWDGTANMGFPKSSERLPVGTYYYIVEIESLPKPIIGWVYLNY